jgi:transposase
MIKIQFTEEAIDELRYQRFNHPHPRVQRKMEALLLKSDGLPHHQITRILGISENTLRQYLREYEEGGIEALKTLHFRKPQSELSEHRQSLEAYFEEHPPATVNEAIAKIEELTGILRGPTQVRKFLDSLGLRPRKIGMIPAKADLEEQDRFKKKNWSRDCRRRGRMSELCTSWMRRISCWRRSLDSSGRGSVGSSGRPPADSVSTCWERSTP